METILWSVGVGMTLMLGVPPLWLQWNIRRNHIRKLWARIDPMWEDGVRNGGWLILTNGSDWPARNILVMAPAALHATDFESIGPREVLRRFVPEQEMGTVTDQGVTLQLEDARHKLWLWTPLAKTLSPIPPPITPLARLVQFVVGKLSDRQQTNFHTRFLARLPHGLVVLLWGYDPVGDETVDYLESHLQRANDILGRAER